ncbi:hypothetical protein CRUP_005546 [Coryphaenoides rupestris]|nr:hypothetical protein CRUP_005546 [Coryphaenoides rupestris]
MLTTAVAASPGGESGPDPGRPRYRLCGMAATVSLTGPSTSPSTSSTAPPAASTLLDVEHLLGLPPSLLQMTEDQLPGAHFVADPSTPFVSFSPPIDHDDYLWSLEDSEGVSDFFDTYDLGDLLRS